MTEILEEPPAEVSDDEVDPSSGGEEGEDQTEEISGWADSMLNILKSTKPKNKKNLILSRARKDYEVNKSSSSKPSKKGGDIEIAKDERKLNSGEKAEEKDGDGTVADGKPQEDDNVLSFKQQRKLELRQRKLELAWENLNRLTATAPDREMETDLLKIATKGVVQLFNAVAQQQKTVKTKLRASNKSEFKKEKVLSQSKTIFDDAMSRNKIVGKSDDLSDTDDIKVKDETSSDSEDGSDGPRKVAPRKRKTASAGESSSSKRPVWQAIQDDFMLGAKLKDWDKESDSD